MAKYRWRADSGTYWNPSASNSDSCSAGYYMYTRSSLYLGFPDIAVLLGANNKGIRIKKKNIFLKSATLNIYVKFTDAGDVTEDVGYNYSTSFGDRRSLSAGKEMKIHAGSTGWKSYDVTNIVNTFIKDNQQNAYMIMWWNGTGGSGSASKPSALSGYNEANCPYIDLEYELSTAYVYSNDKWNNAIPYVYSDGLWKPTISRIQSDDGWR